MARSDPRWLRQAGFGVMTHYLAGLPGSGDDAYAIPAEEWYEQVAAVDADALAQQVASTGAGYLLFAVGQNSGHYCSPNETYDKLTGLTPSKLSPRDLIAELAAAAARAGIRLMVYTTSGAPNEPLASAALGCDNHPKEPGLRQAEFQFKWAEIHREWSLRWGRRVHGWWVDGCYRAQDMYDFPDEPNWGTLCGALKAGNPDSLVAFNPGVKVPVMTQGEEDYTAGELAGALHVGGYVKGGFAGPPSQVGGAQYHVLTFLGEFWRVGDGPRFPDDLAVGYTRYVIEHGGVVTWDVPIDPLGRIPEPFIAQLTKIGQALGKLPD